MQKTGGESARLREPERLVRLLLNVEARTIILPARDVNRFVIEEGVLASTMRRVAREHGECGSR